MLFISAVQRSDSVIHIFIRFPVLFHVVYPRLLNIVPCAIGEAKVMLHVVRNRQNKGGCAGQIKFSAENLQLHGVIP